MAVRYSPREVSIPCKLLSSNTRVTGNAKANYYWVTDLLNASDRDFVLIEDATVRSLAQEVGNELKSRSVLLRKENVIIGVPLEKSEVEEGAASYGSVSGSVSNKVVVKAGPFVISGVLQLPRSASLLQYLIDAAWVYLPMTDATVTHDAAAFVRFTSPFLVVNRNWVDALLEEPVATAVSVEQLTSTAAPDPAVADTHQVLHDPQQPADVTPPLSQETAEILFASEIFKAADRATLQQVVTNLVSTDGLAQQSFPAGTAVVRQGEQGDSLYIVERGSLEVIVGERPTNSSRVLATLGPGDVFGEMALLGDGRRTATVRAVSDVVLFVLSADSWRVLASRLPAATTDLLRIMAQRRGPRGVLLHRSL